MRAGRRWHKQLALAILGSRLFVPVNVCISVTLSLGIVATVLVRTGGWPSFLVQPPPAVVITGPGVDPAGHTLQMAVLGAVQQPGSYLLHEGAVTRDAIAAAGGMLISADASRVNMDAPLADGGVVYVPAQGESLPVMLNGRIALNVATAEQLHASLGISLVIARRIVAYRDAHGPFTAVSQLLLVPISRTEYDRIKLLVLV